MMMKLDIVNNRGSIIIVSLLTLALLSLLGIASTTKSRTDINIASNSKEIDNALYKAENALVEAEMTVPNMHKFKKLDELNIQYHFGTGDTAWKYYKEEDNKVIAQDDMNSKAVSDIPISTSGGATIVGNSPLKSRYAIKSYKFIPDCDNLGSGGCSDTGIDIYKVVAVSKDRNGTPITVLETMFHWRHR